MATIYIAKTGNDTTGNGTVGNPYLTISKGISVAVTGDTIEVAVGTYNEKLVTGDKSLTFDASGAVVLDGSVGALTTPAISLNTTTAGRSITFEQKPTSSGTWTIQNYIGTSLVTIGSNSATHTFNNVTFSSNSNTAGYYNTTITAISLIMSYCSFLNFTGVSSYCVNTVGSTANNIYNCTFTNCYYGLGLFNSANIIISNNTFTNVVYPIWFNTSPTPLCQNNTYTNCYGWGYANVGKNWANWKLSSATIDNVGSTSNTLGLTIYVNKSGNDSNVYPYTPATAKLTIQAGINALVANGDSIIIGSGNYNEKIIYSKNVNTYYDGVVELDGTALASNTAITIPGGTVNFLPMSTGGKLIIKNHAATSLMKCNDGVNIILTISGIDFFSSGNNFALNLPVARTVSHPIYISNCVFSGFNIPATPNAAIYVYETGTNTSQFYMYNNTFYNNSRGIYISQNLGSYYFYNNIMHTSTYPWVFSGLPVAINTVKNQYYNTTTGFFIGPSTTYANLSAAQSAGYEIGSITTDPQFEDTANNIFYLKTASSLGRTQGAIPFGYTTGSNAADSTWIVTASANNTGWYSADGNIAKNGTTGFFEMVGGTSALLLSPVIDLGTSQAVNYISLATVQTWPTNMIDTTKTDTKPNYQTVEIRGSGSTFAQDNGVISWSEVKTEQYFSPVISGRYIQLRLTFRNDDVGA